MADQGKVLITMTVPASSARGTILSGAGTKSATIRPAGVLYDSTDAGQTTGQVQVSGTALVVLGGTVAAGDTIKSTATGTGVKATLATDINTVVGIALEAGASGELRTVLLK